MIFSSTPISGCSKKKLFYLAQSDVNMADLFPEVRPIYMVLLISNILLIFICFLEITHVCIIFHFSFPGFVCILFDLRRENSS